MPYPEKGAKYPGQDRATRYSEFDQGPLSPNRPPLQEAVLPEEEQDDEDDAVPGRAQGGSVKERLLKALDYGTSGHANRAFYNATRSNPFKSETASEEWLSKRRAADQADAEYVSNKVPRRRATD